MGDPLTPTPERFHALARSSPWRWSTLRFTWESFTWPDGPEPRRATVPVRAWVRRPDALRVEDLDGSVRTARVDPSLPTRGTPLVRVWGPEEPTHAATVDDVRNHAEEVERLVEPGVDADGLVRERPPHREEADDPMWHNCTFVGALDPVEFANPHGGRMGTRIEDLRAIDHHGRPAWEAILHPTVDYDPRCPCCSLLLAPSSFLGDEPDPGLAFPDAHWVRLDVQTGICVVAEQIGGSRAGMGHEIVVEAVDEPMEDDLFGR